MATVPARRFILYVSNVIPGNVSFELITATGKLDAVQRVRQFADDTGMDACATVYGFDSESWAEAQEYREIGCPFDYPMGTVDLTDSGTYKFNEC